MVKSWLVFFVRDSTFIFFTILLFCYLFLDVKNNQLKCSDYFILFLMHVGDDDQQISYWWSKFTGISTSWAYKCKSKWNMLQHLMTSWNLIKILKIWISLRTYRTTLESWIIGQVRIIWGLDIVIIINNRGVEKIM